MADHLGLSMPLILAAVMPWVAAVLALGLIETNPRFGPLSFQALSDWFAGSHGSDAASLRLALLVLAPTGFWATYHFYLATKTIIEDQKCAIDHQQGRARPAPGPLLAAER